MIYQRRADLQPLTNIEENVDCSRLYSNLAEIPSFISSHRQSAMHQEVNCSADPSQLQGKQLQVYNCVSQHLQSGTSPIHIIVSGTAGTSKSYLINCLKLLLQNQLRVCAPTGVASYNTVYVVFFEGLIFRG